ncbi:MAG: ferric reductase-like transmembrane domain-containing protein [Acidobacteriota bacterium]|nr:ferric reductase-like transmembrane domain-containing protein [Acidobacteriota bacterium]
MIALTSPYLWYSTRATAMVTLVLFTLVVSLGTFVANRVGGAYVGRFEVNELHRSVSMVAIVFLGIHVATTVVDSYVNTGVLSVFVPMTSAYRRVAIGVGAVALDLMAAVWISSLLKARIANTTWRFIHWFGWLAFATAIVHAFLAGTDTRKGWGLIVVGVCAIAGVAAGLWRFFGRPARAAGRTALSPLTTAPERVAPPAPRAPQRPTTRPLGAAAPRRASEPFPRREGRPGPKRPR